MEIGAITGYIDVAQVVLYVFWAFFAFIIYYLIQENKREGYPLDTDSLDPAGRRPIAGITSVPSPKSFRMADGKTYYAPDPARADRRVLNATAVHKAGGSPIEPTGDPLLAGVGPGSYAERDDTPDMTFYGTPKIVPMRIAEGFHVDHDDPDPRGMDVVGADGEVGGVVKEIWVDTPEHLIRFLEVDVNGASKLFPINLCVVRRKSETVKVASLLSTQFGNIPDLKSLEQITRLEEEKLFGYFGAGTLYATLARSEPIV